MTIRLKIRLSSNKVDSSSPHRSNTLKRGKVNWFDVVTTTWAIALVIASVLWVTTPAFAGRGRGGDDEVDCMGACVLLDKCDGSGGCARAGQGGGECYGECGDGSSWECGYAFDV